MTVLRADDFEAFLKNKSARMNGLLLHGSDAEAVGVLARQATRTLCEAEKVPGSLHHLDVAVIKENPGALIDEFQSLSLLGDRQILLADGVDDNFLKFAKPAIETTKLANFLVILAGSLAKSSKLRLACEDATLFASLAVYEEDRAALSNRLRKQMAEHGLKWAGDAEASFFERVGHDRPSVNQEMAKLLLYCLGMAEITEEDVLAICGNTAAFGTDELIDAMLQGDGQNTDRMAASFDGDQRTILIMVLNHLTRLQNLRAEIDSGSSYDAVMRSAKPPIFFKRQSNIKSQIRRYDSDGLYELQELVSSAILQTRKIPSMADAITNRTLLSIARNAAARSL